MLPASANGFPNPRPAFIRKAYQAGMALLLMVAGTVSGQQESPGDSLERIFLSGAFPPNDSLRFLEKMTNQIEDPVKLLRYSEVLIEVAERQDSAQRAMIGYRQKGTAFRLLGDYQESLENFFHQAELAIKTDSRIELGTSYITVADVYSLMDHNQNARNYYNKAIGILRDAHTAKDSTYLGSALSNTGDEYYKQGKLDSALVYFEEAGSIFRALGYALGTGYYKGSLGMVYSEQGNYPEALANLGEAIAILEKERDPYGVAAFLPFVSETYRRMGNLDAAVRQAHKSLDIALEYGMKEEISKANLLLAELYEAKGDPYRSLDHYKTYQAYLDSIRNIGLVQEMARLRTDFEVAQKQARVDLLEKEAEIQQLTDKRRLAIIYVVIGILIGVFLFAYGMYRRYRFIKSTSDIIAREKARSDLLLRNILPEETAEELKQHGKVGAKRFESVTVLFADFEGFTHHSEKMNPEDLVKTIDFYFSEFDRIVESYGLEKIKTMGDCYMCAGGLPFPSDDHAQRMVQAAIAFKTFVQNEKAKKSKGTTRFDIRIGINTGPVVAGVVGTKKFAYDIWGDTVNIASRMESSSLPGRINLSENTFNLVRGQIPCEFRGMIQVKNKGMMKMYFVTEPEEESPPAERAETLEARC